MATKRSFPVFAGDRPAPEVRPDHVRSAYRRWAPIYELFASPIALAREHAVKRVNRLSGRILEAGVGTGSALGMYGRHLEIVGVDLSRDMLSRAREKVGRERLSNVEGLAEMDLTALGFHDGAFDHVVCMFTITAVPDPAAVMAEFKRVVRPGGRILIASHFRAEKGPWRITDALLSPFKTQLGWDPAMPVERLGDVAGLVLADRTELPPAGLAQLLEFERV